MKLSIWWPTYGNSIRMGGATCRMGGARSPTLPYLRISKVCFNASRTRTVGPWCASSVWTLSSRLLSNVPQLRSSLTFWTISDSTVDAAWAVRSQCMRRTCLFDSLTLIFNCINYISYSLLYISDYMMEQWLKTGSTFEWDNSDTEGEGCNKPKWKDTEPSVETKKNLKIVMNTYLVDLYVQLVKVNRNHNVFSVLKCCPMAVWSQPNFAGILKQNIKDIPTNLLNIFTEDGKNCCQVNNKVNKVFYLQNSIKLKGSSVAKRLETTDRASVYLKGLKNHHFWNLTPNLPDVRPECSRKKT